MMLSLKHVSKHRSRSFFSSIITISNNPSSSFSSYTCLSSSSPYTPPQSFAVTQNDVANSFKTWFRTRNHTKDPLLNRIYEILASDDDFAAPLSRLSLPLSESFVLKVLRYGGHNGDVLSRLKFFDWAGRQPGFHHTRGTFIIIFRILSRAMLMPLVLDFLHAFRERGFGHGVRFNDTLVVGYAIAGKPEVALHLFGEMRFKGLDLDSYSYHILLNALVEQNCFDAFDAILKQIRLRGYENRFTYVIVVKCLCRRGRLKEAEAYLKGLVGGGKELNGSEVGFLVGALCQSNRFDRAVKLVVEFGNSAFVPLENAYGVWIRSLVRRGMLDEALEFYRQKKDSEGYVPGLARYNILICRLLSENRLLQVYDLLVDMYETGIPPDTVTMNAVLCFFCKVGMADVALGLYYSRSQFGLSPDNMAYKYLILTLCWDGNVEEAYSVLRSSIDQGFFPDRQTFSTLASALCRDCKIDEMKELLRLSLRWNFMPNASTYDKFISALSRAGRVEDGYLIHGELNSVIARASYVRMIKGFVKLNRGDIAARLLIEMQGKGHKLTPSLCKTVIFCLLDMNNPRANVFNLLEMLTHREPHCEIYNYFSNAALLANKADLAREVIELMQRKGIEPNMGSKILMLKTCLKSGRISDALNFFNNLQCQALVSKKLYNTLIVGLCKANMADIAHEFLFKMIKAGSTPSIECYEELVQLFCSMNRYHEAINIVNVYEKMGRQVTSFLGNVLLFHSLVSTEVYDTCIRLIGVKEGTFSGISMLSLIVGVFSGRLRVNYSIEDLEELIGKCFPLDIYTYNLLLRKVCKSDMDQACELFDRMCERGYEPNWWTYDIMVHGFSKQGRKDEAKRWVKEMCRKGLYPAESD